MGGTLHQSPSLLAVRLLIPFVINCFLPSEWFGTFGGGLLLVIRTQTGDTVVDMQWSTNGRVLLEYNEEQTL